MKGDFTRFRHDPRRAYTAVLRQQGRVDVDADWNEQVAIGDELTRAQSVDVIGPCGVPERGGGFAIRVVGTAAQPDLAISPGTMYVDGILCRQSPPEFAVTGIAAGARVRLDRLCENGVKLERGGWVELLADGTRLVAGRINAVQADQPSVTLDAAIPAAAPGAALTLRPMATYLRQPQLPIPPALRRSGGRDLVYLDVWQRHVTAVEDPRIREIALGGPDTTTRVETVWQVQVATDVTDQALATGSWRPRASGARLTTGTLGAPATEDDPCRPAATSGYRGPENRLYRVEVHDPLDPDGHTTFKWSRDNGSIVFPIESFVEGRPDQIVVERLGRDRLQTLSKDDWVEVLGDESELAGQPGTLAKVTGLDEATRKVTLDRAVARHGDETRPRLRVWSQTGDEPPTVNGQPVELEAGIEIAFSGAAFRAGDWWAFAARTADASVETLDREPPSGVDHHYCPLALLTWGNPQAPPTVQDKRPRFGRLTRRTLHYLGGDGQQARVTRRLGQPLAAGVTAGGAPIDGAIVRFSAAGGGSLATAADGAGGGTIDVPTVDGVALAWWTLGSEQEDQVVQARLLDDAGQPFDPPLRYTATFGGRRLRYLGGDGQEAIPGQAVGRPLRAGVVRGSLPVENANVRFRVGAGGGALFADQALTHPLTAPVPTTHGVAECWWRLGAAGAQVVQAALLDDQGQEADLPIAFSAGLSVASDVAYDFSTGGPLAALTPPPDTVQEAIDELARLRRADPGLHVVGLERVDAGGSAQDLANDSITNAAAIAGGVAVVLRDGEAIDHRSVASKPVMSLTLGVPLMFSDRPSPSGPAAMRHFGYAPTVLAGDLAAVGNRVVWIPHEGTRAWLSSELPRIVGVGDSPTQLLVQLTLKGNFVWADGQPDLFLDGDVFGAPAPNGTTGLRTPSGDDRRGGDFEAWFWLDVVAARTELADLTLDPSPVIGGDEEALDRFVIDPDRVVGGEESALDRLELDPSSAPGGGEATGVDRLQVDPDRVVGGEEPNQ